MFVITAGFIIFLFLGTPRSLVEGLIGGSDASRGQFPYQASLENYRGYVCSGAIVNHFHVLTTSECLSNAHEPQNKISKVRVGTVSIDEDFGTTYRVKQEIRHTKYNPISSENNIGLLRLYDSIQFTEFVKAIPLRKSRVDSGVTVLTSSWGANAVLETNVATLQYLYLRTSNHRQCAEIFANSTMERKVSLGDLCTFTLFGEGTCHGDDGGPLVLNGTLVGVNSWRRPCARGVPDVFVRVSSYLTWIQENAQSESN